jgi:hypothetical protein
MWLLLEPKGFYADRHLFLDRRSRRDCVIQIHADSLGLAPQPFCASVTFR